VPEQQHHGRRDDGLPAARTAAAADILAFVGQHLNKERPVARAAYAQGERGTARRHLGTHGSIGECITDEDGDGDGSEERRSDKY
jgi:hypothetical protein